MVFPGKFSTGCSRCRQRKVKCDEGKPSCRRCYIYGKPCPGYTDQFRFRHSSQSQGLGQQQFQSQGPTQTQFQVTQGPPVQTSVKTSPSSSKASLAAKGNAPVFETISFPVQPPGPTVRPAEQHQPPPQPSPSTQSLSPAVEYIKIESPASQASEISHIAPHRQARRQSHAQRRKKLLDKDADKDATSAAILAAAKGRPLDASVFGVDVLFPQILPSPELSYNDISLSYFVSRFVSLDGADAFPGHMTWLPNLFNQYDQKGPFELATLCVAQMAAFNKFGSEKFKYESYKNHGKALKALQDVIMGGQNASKDQSKKLTQEQADIADDKLLATVLLLCAYKDISGEGLGDPSNHASGIYYLLERRGLEQISTRRGFELYILALLRLQVYSFLHEDDTYFNPGGMTNFLAQFDPLMRAMQLMSQVHVLRHNLSKLTLNMMQQKRKSPSPPATSPPAPTKAADPADPASPQTEVPLDHHIDDNDILASCFHMLEELDDWDAEAASYWMKTFRTRTVPKTLGGLVGTQTHYDPETACTIILIRSVRFILLLTLLEHHQRMQIITNNRYAGPGGQGAPWSECIPVFRETIESTISDILGLVPFALGDVDPNGRPTSMTCDGAGALMILHPLRLVTYCPYATPEQVKRGREVLDRINKQIGIRSAQAWHENDLYRWGFLASSPREMLLEMGTLSIVDDDASTA